MRYVLVALTAVATVMPAHAVDLDVTPQDIERALAIARGTDAERATFHRPYIQAVNTPFVETVEIVSEYRRVVLMAEEHARKGDRAFTYSASMAQKAVGPWNRRVALVARVRFHPQNNYVDVPAVDVVLEGNKDARIGVLKQPVLALGSRPGDRQPVLGATVEGVFDAVAVGQGPRQFVVLLDKKEIGRFTFDLAVLD